jgi:hypothetical protein
VAGFDGGAVTSDAGGLLLGAADKAIGLVRRLAGCFRDARDSRYIEHTVATLVGQRVFGIALGYEDLNDHDDLRHDPVMSVLAGKLGAWRSNCAPVAGKSTLNRLELSRATPTKYRKIAHDPAAIEGLFVDLFIEAHAKAPKQITLTSTPPTIPCTAIRRAGSSTPTTTATATCRFTCSAADICWRPSFDAPTSTAARVRGKRLLGSSRKSGRAGHACAFCCEATPASAARS